MNPDYCRSQCDRVEKIIAANHATFSDQYHCIQSKIARTEYGIGGETLHRGYYCPSLIGDIVVGNVKRGRITSNPVYKKRAEYVYGFDRDNRLIVAEHPYGKEIISYDDTTVVGCEFSENGEIEIYSECIYSDSHQLLSYQYYLFGPSHRSVMEFSEERYCYQGNSVVVDWCRCFWAKRNKPILQHEKYTFLTTDGFLSSYTCEEYVNGEKVPRLTDGRVYKVYVKRKVPL